MPRPYIYADEFFLAYSQLSSSGESSMFYFSVLGFSGRNSSHDNHFNLFLNVFFVHLLKMSNFGDQRLMRASSDDGEGTRLINR